jgi:tRNA threonylcarbamoyladenosine biosynthesis protein TsaE
MPQISMLADRPDTLDTEPLFRRALPEDADGMVEVIHAAFGARPPLDPPSDAATETPGSVAAAVTAGSGVYATIEGRPAGAMVIDIAEDTATLRRVSVHPDFQKHGIANAMIYEAELLAAQAGARTIQLIARTEFPGLIDYWQRRGFAVAARQQPHQVTLVRRVPARVPVPTADDMHRLGARLGDLLRPGDVILACGELGAGKTTLTQGIGDGLGVSGPVISPTFVLSRIHRAAGDRPDLVHVDGYRLSSADELADLDLDESLNTSVTVVEWGEGIAEMLSADRLEITVLRSTDPADETRTVLIDPIGDRWARADLDKLGAEAGAHG